MLNIMFRCPMGTSIKYIKNNYTRLTLAVGEKMSSYTEKEASLALQQITDISNSNEYQVYIIQSLKKGYLSIAKKLIDQINRFAELLIEVYFNSEFQ